MSFTFTFECVEPVAQLLSFGALALFALLAVVVGTRVLAKHEGIGRERGTCAATTGDWSESQP